jgi:hypothetical protein
VLPTYNPLCPIMYGVARLPTTPAQFFFFFFFFFFFLFLNNFLFEGKFVTKDSVENMAIICVEDHFVTKVYQMGL